tara:strand:+ start:929 stop:1759 length:831 start_codon:yes stop_codon:yes gene_type:complete
MYILLSVLLSALLHASWNAIIKFGDDKFQGMFVLSIGHGVFGFFLIVIYPIPNHQSWFFLIGSVAFHMFYKYFLTLAYEKGDLSHVYPITRGTSPILVLIASLLALPDPLTTGQIGGIGTVGLGILFLARGAIINKEGHISVLYAILAAIGTAGYTIFDGLGARASGTTLGYVGWLFFLDAIIFIGGGIALRGKRMIPKSGKDWNQGLLAGAASVGAYAIAIWAMTVAQIAIIAALREISIIFAFIIGILFFHEKASIQKLLPTIMVITGVVCISI